MIDTNVLSEIRKKQRANVGVQRFFQQAIEEEVKLYISVVSIGELRRGIELIRHRGDTSQAALLETWLIWILQDYHENILMLDEDTAQLWGKLRSPHAENALDKQIAATALIHGLTVVTRNIRDFSTTGVALLDPFE